MKTPLSFLLILSSLATQAQQFHVDWTKFIGLDSGFSSINYAIPSRDGGIIFTGNTFAYDTTSGDIPASTWGGGVALGKLDSNRNIAWIQLYGGAYGDNVCQTSDGGYAILAYTGTIGAAFGDITGYHGNGDMWLIRTDSIGNFLWGNCYGSDSFQELPLSIAATKDDGFILLGISNGSGQDVPYHLGGPDEFEFDWFVVKTDSLGNKQWVKDLGGSNDEAPNNYGTILEANNGYYLISSSWSTDYDCIDTAWHSGVNTLDDYYVLRLDDSGDVVWAKSFGGSRYDELYSAVLDPNDSTVVITGNTTSGDYMVSDCIWGGGSWTIKVDKNGNLVWKKCVGGLASYTSGSTGLNVSLNRGSGYIVSCGIGGYIGMTDIEVRLIDTSGAIVTDTIFGGTNDDGVSNAFPYKQGYIVAGGSHSNSGYTEGENLGTLGWWGNKMAISYLDYWPASVENVGKDKEQWSLYPNPTLTSIQIVFSLANTQGTLSISNVLGQTVYNQQTNKQTKHIDIATNSWADGLYIVQWKGEDGKVLTAKLLKQ